MKEITSNINIIGGGLIGAVTAYSLSKLDYKITILEKNDQFSSKKYKDYRTIAISEGTKTFLEKLNLWSDISRFAQPIKRIKVIDRKLSNFLEFDNKRRKSNLGYIVKNIHLLNIIYKKLKNNRNVLILNNSQPENFRTYKDSIITDLNDCTIFSDINIAADGKKSFVRKQLKTPTFIKNYNKSAFVTTFTHSNSHLSTAFEFFYKNGPLAILPMQELNNNFRSSIVWTNNREYLEKLFDIDNKSLQLILGKETRNSVGKINKIITKQLFPLNAHLSSSFYENRTIYIGDAAHSFHPIAGQGWNLGMKGVENLFYLAKKYKSIGIEIGNKSFCKEYHNENYYRAYRLYQLTDKLDSIFTNQNSIISLCRSFGFGFFQKNKTINNLISDFAMGIN